MEREILLSIGPPQKLCANCNGEIHSIERHPSILRILDELAASSTIWAAAKLSSVAVNVSRLGADRLRPVDGRLDIMRGEADKMILDAAQAERQDGLLQIDIAPMTAALSRLRSAQVVRL